MLLRPELGTELLALRKVRRLGEEEQRGRTLRLIVAMVASMPRTPSSRSAREDWEDWEGFSGEGARA